MIVKKPTYEKLEQRVKELEEEAEALRESEEKYRLVVENANEGILVAQDGMLKYVNPKLTEISGYSAEQLTSKAFIDFVHPHDHEMVMEHHRRRLAGKEEPQVYHLRMIDKDKNTRWLRNNGVIINWEGRPATLNFMSDITEQKRIQAALKESEDQFRSLFEESPIGIEIYDSEARLINANKSCLNIFGISDLRQVIDSDLFKGLNVTDEVRERLDRGESVGYEVSFDFEKVKESNLYKTNRSGIVYLDVQITPLGAKGQRGLNGYLAQVRDISDRRRSEEQIRNLTQQLLRAQENERQMISRELHDSVAQDLSSLIIGWETLFDNQSGTPDEIREKVLEFSRILKKTISNVRDLSYLLRPPTMDHLGIVQTISQYCEDFSEKTGISVDFISTGLRDIKVDSDTEINLYRLIQEALNNIRKHADANQVVIKMVAAYPSIILRIGDDGKGFDVEKRLAALTNGKRMGLRSMKERVTLLGGKMKVQSQPGKGTKILIEVPFMEEESGAKEEYPHHR